MFQVNDYISLKLYNYDRFLIGIFCLKKDDFQRRL